MIAQILACSKGFFLDRTSPFYIIHFMIIFVQLNDVSPVLNREHKHLSEKLEKIFCPNGYNA